MYFSETSKVVTADNLIPFLLVIKGKHGQFGKDKCRVKSCKFMKINTFRVKWFVIWQIVNLPAFIPIGRNTSYLKNLKPLFRLMWLKSVPNFKVKAQLPRVF